MSTAGAFWEISSRGNDCGKDKMLMKKNNEKWTTFSTGPGICGISWNDEGVTSFHLPEASGRLIEKRLKKITGNPEPADVQPGWIKKVLRKVKAHMKGDVQDFSDVPLCMNENSEFQLAVFREARKIPPGTVVTYGELAALVGKPGAARAVGTALGKNPALLFVPCHRVIRTSGNLGGFSAPGGLKTKAALLECEGVCLPKPSEKSQ